MIYLHNPEIGGSDIIDYVVGEPGRSRRYNFKKGETWGFEDEVAHYFIRVFGVKGGEQHGLMEGFLEMVEPQKAKKEKKVVQAEVIEVEKDGKTVYGCSVCDYTHEKKIGALGHIRSNHKDGEEVEIDSDVQVDDFKIQEGDAVVPPEEIDRLRRARQEMTSMKPKRSLADLRPKSEDEMGYRQPGRRLDFSDSGMNTNPNMAKHFYGPGLQEDTEV
ncbi:MAG: hypothetical protein [Podoviridae sp. ctg2L5]|nr:MAG: hypothetical protein [Podoviridae sp. ctg2L5]